MMEWEGLYVQNDYHAYLLRRIVMLKAEADVLADYNHYAKGEPMPFLGTILLSRSAMRVAQAAAQARSIESGVTIPAALVRPG